jgi:diguanylate cyclase (GGDEF)-like protein
VERLLYQLGPRDRSSAVLSAASIYLLAGLVVGLSNVLIPEAMGPGARVTMFVISAWMAAFGLIVWLVRSRWTTSLLITAPLFGLWAICILDLASKDASASAQVSLCLPVLYAASQLRIAGAIAALVTAMMVDAIVILEVKPTSAGLLDFIYVVSNLGLMTLLLVLAGLRQDRLVDTLEHLAGTDPLTGLVTRRRLESSVEEALAGHDRDAGTALLLIDIDHFKSINDSHGHPVGDEALVHVATLLGLSARPDAVISRLGGDELALLLPSTPQDTARSRAEGLIELVRTTPLLLPNGSPLHLSISVGLAQAPDDGLTLEALYACADAALYDAKRCGRGRVGRTRSDRDRDLNVPVDAGS